MSRKRQKRIGIACYPWLGGSGILGTNLAESLKKHGHSVSLISTAPPFRLTRSNIRFHAATPIPHPSFQNFIYQSSATETMIRAVIADRLEILHAHYLFPFGAAAIEAKEALARQGRMIKVVLTVHGTDIITIAQHYATSLTAYLLKKADAVTTASIDLKSRTDSILGAKKAIVIPNFVDFQEIDRIRPVSRRQFAQNGQRLLIHISNFRPIKRLDDTLSVFQRIRRVLPAKLVLVGDVDMLSRQRVMKKIAKDRDVILVGKRRNVFRYLKAADAIISTSNYENCSMTILEALACSVPVLATKVGGNAEFVDHGFSGYLAPLGDVRKLADDGISLLSDKKKLAAFRKNAYVQAMTYDSKKIIPRYELLYRLISNGDRLHVTSFSEKIATL